MIWFLSLYTLIAFSFFPIASSFLFQDPAFYSIYSSGWYWPAFYGLGFAILAVGLCVPTAPVMRLRPFPEDRNRLLSWSYTPEGRNRVALDAGIGVSCPSCMAVNASPVAHCSCCSVPIDRFASVNPIVGNIMIQSWILGKALKGSRSKPVWRGIWALLAANAVVCVVAVVWSGYFCLRGYDDGISSPMIGLPEIGSLTSDDVMRGLEMVWNGALFLLQNYLFVRILLAIHAQREDPSRSTA